MIFTKISLRFTDLPRLRRNVFSSKQDTTQKHIVESEEKAATNTTKKIQRPRFNLSRNTIIPFDPFKYRCQEKFSVDCQNKTKLFASKVLTEFRKSLTKAVSEEPNFYNVDYSAVKKSEQNPICLVMQAKVRTLRKKDSPFNVNHIGQLFPKRKLFKNVAKELKSCAIISSAGSMAKSKLGHFIGNYIFYSECLY